jgi:glycosyltransferase involved in cell wall biosynthesis
MQPGLVSVMMPAYNAEQYIGQAIESLLAQSYPDWELIVVNDGSTDGTAEIVTQFADARLKVFHQANAGEAAARNSALKQMQGEFVAFLDADDLFLPHHLEVMVKYLQTHPNCGGVYSDGYYIDQAGTRLKPLSSRRRGPFVGRVFEEAVYASDLFGPPVCVVLRYNIIAQHGLSFDKNIVIGPDWDFFIHFADVAQFGYVDQHTCLYRVHQTNITARINLQRRALEIAKCREKAIKMKNFQTCSIETRSWVFYDLLINLLRGFADRQSDITRWPEFSDLPPGQQARLLRLMASRAVTNGEKQIYITEWLHRSRQLNPLDLRGAWLSLAYNLSPSICRLMLRFKNRHEIDPLTIPPFADLEQVYSP